MQFQSVSTSTLKNGGPYELGKGAYMLHVVHRLPCLALACRCRRGLTSICMPNLYNAGSLSAKAARAGKAGRLVDAMSLGPGPCGTLQRSLANGRAEPEAAFDHNGSSGG